MKELFFHTQEIILNFYITKQINNFYNILDMYDKKRYLKNYPISSPILDSRFNSFSKGENVCS